MFLRLPMSINSLAGNLIGSKLFFNSTEVHLLTIKSKASFKSHIINKNSVILPLHIQAKSLQTVHTDFDYCSTAFFLDFIFGKDFYKNLHITINIRISCRLSITAQVSLMKPDNLLQLNVGFFKMLCI